MPNTREKLIELANAVLRCLPWGEISSHTADDVADHLIANGVTIPVRCKDCKWWLEDEIVISECRCSYWKGLFDFCKADDFCSHGERRNDAQS